MHYLMNRFINKVFNQTKYILPILLTSLGNLHAETLEHSSINVYQQLNSQIDKQWQSFSKNPLSKQSYFTHDNIGNIHLFKNNVVNLKPIIDLKEYFPKIHSLAVISVHPSFNVPQTYGYLTLFSAHTEPANLEKKTPRIKEDKNQTNLKFEIVISEWVFNDEQLTPLNIKNNQPREVLRIPVSSSDMSIMQLQFNPYMKSWNENYGQLFFTLKADPNQPDSALYSGSILRINPAKFGFNSYTIPKTNPFIKIQGITDEIIATGLKDLSEIHWAKDESKKLLFTRFNQENFSASLINYGFDFRNNNATLKEITAPFPQKSNSVIYRGMKFSKFRNNVVYLTWDKYWKLIAISNSSPNKVSTLTTFNDNVLSQNRALALLTDEHDELLILDKAQQVIFNITLPQSHSIHKKEHAKSSESNVNQQENQTIYWLMLCLLLLTGIMVYRYSKKLHLPKTLLRKHFANFTIRSHKIYLFKRHEDNASVELSISDVIRSDILLNKELIYSFNGLGDELDCFSNQAEKMICLSFATEKRAKMVDDKVRQIELLLIDKTRKVYPICIYLRKGNQRLTKAKYEETCRQLVDWCWLLSQVIYLEKTEKRIIIEPEISPATATLNRKKIVNNSTVQTNTSNIEPNTNTTEKKSPITQKAPSSIPLATQQEQEQENVTNEDQQHREVSLINALDKLAKLKQQGLLTDIEFSEAKAKLLTNLASSD